MEEKILEFLVEICEDDVVKVERDIDLFEEDLLDSMGFIELIVGIQDTFGVVISPTEIAREDINTPNKIIDIIKSKI